MSHGFIERADMPKPAAHPIEWEVKMPPLDEAESIEDRAVAVWIVIDGKRLPSILRRRVRRAVRVDAQSWFEARREACLYWSRNGIHFNPQSVR